MKFADIEDRTTTAADIENLKQATRNHRASG
jgi:hypothetical protein